MYFVSFCIKRAVFFVNLDGRRRARHVHISADQRNPGGGLRVQPDAAGHLAPRWYATDMHVFRGRVLRDAAHGWEALARNIEAVGRAGNRFITAYGGLKWTGTATTSHDDLYSF